MRKLTEMKPKGLKRHYNKKIKQIKNEFEIEKNIKNNLYFFILENNLIDRLKEWQRGINMSQPGGHKKAIQYLILSLPENSN